MKKYLNIIAVIFSVWGFVSCQSGPSVKTVKNKVVQKTEDVVLGNFNAPQTIFLYASYHCDYCRYFFSRTYPQLKSNYLDKGKLKLVIKWVDFNDNPQVLYALQAASCIGRFGVYDKFHQLLLLNPDVVFTEDFARLVDDIMEDNLEIAECVLQNNDYEYLRSNVIEFNENELTGTPTFVINNHVYSGFISYENFEKIIIKEFKSY